MIIRSLFGPSSANAAEMAATRPRFVGSDEDIVAALAPIVKAKGKTWLKYEEHGKVKDAPVNVTAILKAADVLQALATVDQKLDFKRSQFVHVVCMILEKNKGAWKFPTDHASAYTTTMVNRLMNITNHVAQNLSRPKPALWTQKLNMTGLNTVAAPPEALAPPQAAAASLQAAGPVDLGADGASPPYECGWKKDLGLGYRIRVGAPWKDAELAEPCFAGALALLKEQGRGNEALVVSFLDGSTAVLPDMTNERALELLETTGQAPKKTKLIAVEHKATHHALTVSQRAGPWLFLSLFEQSRQIGQIRVDLWGVLPEPQPRVIEDSHPCVAQAVEFYKPFIEQYASGELATKEDLRNAVKDAIQASNLKNHPSPTAQEKIREANLLKRKEGDEPDREEAEQAPVGTTTRTMPSTSSGSTEAGVPAARKRPAGSDTAGTKCNKSKKGQTALHRDAGPCEGEGAAAFPPVPLSLHELAATMFDVD